MVVDDCDLVGMAISPDEADPPLVVDADRMPPAAIAFQRFEAIGGSNAKIGEALRRIEQTQLAQGDSLNVSGKVPAAAALPDRRSSASRGLPCIVLSRRYAGPNLRAEVPAVLEACLCRGIRRP